MKTENEPRSGIPEIDSLVRLQPSTLMVIGGRTSIGKSALAKTIWSNAAKNGSKVCVFNLETSSEELFMRVLAAEAEVDSMKLQQKRYSKAEEERIADARTRLAGLPVIAFDNMATIREIWQKTQKLSVEGGLDLLIVDYLQLVKGYDADTDRVQEVGEIIRSIRLISRELEIPIIVCSQLDLAYDDNYERGPRLSDLPKAVVEEADVVLLIHRDDLLITEQEWELQYPVRRYPQNVADIIIAKNRYGPTGEVQLFFRDYLTHFFPIGSVTG